MRCRTYVVGDRTEIWVPRGVPVSEVDNCVRHCRVHGKSLVIYRSGRADLVDVTSALLQANRNIDNNRM